MTYQPVVPAAGLVGWNFLKSTITRQTELFNSSASLVRDTDYFAQRISSVETAEDLVSDRRLLRVALGAFGLQDDINSKAFIRQILDQGASDDKALANRLADDRYKKMTEAFGFDRANGPRTREEGFASEINTLFRTRSFEVAVGQQDEGLRLALNAKRELAEIARLDESENTKWFTIMGQQPLRKVFETVLGLPASFGQLDIDRQLEVFKEASARRLGLDTLEKLADPSILEEVVQKYLLREQIASITVQSSSAIALTLLQSAPRSYR